MSAPSASRSTDALRESPREGVIEGERLAAITVPMLFEPGTQEADALRGALSFLFTLIAIYGELLELDAHASYEDNGLQGASGNLT